MITEPRQSLLESFASDRAILKDADQREEGEDAGGRRRLVCAACRNPVTSERQRIEVNGQHEHRCVNPHGYLFHIGCFRDAPGCTVIGAPTTEFSWFRGHAWSHALCTGCAAHLGWRFDGGDTNGFFGLVLDRLATADET